jgi:hypothetical protein
MSRLWKDGISDVKDPDDVDKIEFDWSLWLIGDEEIATSDWEVDDGPDEELVLDDDSISRGTSTIVHWSAGTLGAEYIVRNRIVTNATVPRTKDRSIEVRVRTQ